MEFMAVSIAFSCRIFGCVGLFICLVYVYQRCLRKPCTFQRRSHVKTTTWVQQKCNVFLGPGRPGPLWFRVIYLFRFQTKANSIIRVLVRSVFTDFSSLAPRPIKTQYSRSRVKWKSHVQAQLLIIWVQQKCNLCCISVSLRHNHQKIPFFQFIIS